ncbi:hypothetical protein BDQ17DRAFT_1427779 [Cyathus striatus]|nr:hypothetical protein BDQ17DRAFT_1427779 [Cyathus striatus]
MLLYENNLPDMCLTHPEVIQTQKNINLYANDINAVHQWMMQSSQVDDFPESEWDNIIKGHQVNLSIVSAAISTPNRANGILHGNIPPMQHSISSLTGMGSSQPMGDISATSSPTLVTPLTSLHLTKPAKSMQPVIATSDSVNSTTSSKLNSHTSPVLGNLIPQEAIEG